MKLLNICKKNMNYEKISLNIYFVIGIRFFNWCPIKKYYCTFIKTAKIIQAGSL